MSSNDNKCFQCQETDHMAHYFPHIRCVMIMAMLQQIAPTNFCPQAYQHDTETTTPENMIGPHLGITIAIGITTVTIGIGTDSADLDPTPIIPDIGVTVAVTLAEVTLDPTTYPHATTHHATEAPAHITTKKTPHTADPHHAGVSPETTVDLGHTHHANTIIKHQQDHLPAPIAQLGKPKTGNTSKSPLMTHLLNTIALINGPVTQRMI